MKAMIATLLFVGSAAMGMTNIPEGVYQGQGRWKDNKGLTGSYDISTTVKTTTKFDLVSSTYTFGSKTKQSTLAFIQKIRNLFLNFH
ncbi:MAG: hypothetical protein ACXWRE_05410 [Pseudobdellovibrionaceae bacterium]